MRCGWSRAEGSRRARRKSDLRPPRSELLERGLHGGLGRRVERARRLVEEDDRRVLEEAARDRDALLLAAAQPQPALADDGLPLLLEALHHLEHLQSEGRRECALGVGRATTRVLALGSPTPARPPPPPRARRLAPGRPYAMLSSIDALKSTVSLGHADRAAERRLRHQQMSWPSMSTRPAFARRTGIAAGRSSTCRPLGPTIASSSPAPRTRAAQPLTARSGTRTRRRQIRAARRAQRRRGGAAARAARR